MKLFSVYTDSMAVLKNEWFLRTLKDDWELHFKKIQGEGMGGDFDTSGFWACMKKRLAWLLQIIKENPGEVILWSDIDIQFFRPCQKIIDAAVAGYDLVFQSEKGDDKEINVGFVAIRCNQKTLLFWEAVLKRLDQGKREQDAANHILREKLTDCRWTVFPREIWAFSQGVPLPPNAALHHANFIFPAVRNGKPVSCLKQKIAQLEKFRIYHKYRCFYNKYRYLLGPLHPFRKIILSLSFRLRQLWRGQSL